ncbi:MAG: DUF3465 domain-containing protein [Thermoleophilia bacterium]|jgi:hypothetical protein
MKSRHYALIAVAILVAIALVCLAGMLLCGCAGGAYPAGSGPGDATISVGTGTPDTAADAGDAVLWRAFKEKATDLMVEGRGTVSKILTDDDEGDRHQRFIVTLASGQTLLVAHNIDVAPRVDALQVGDTVSFKGEYEWNSQGGVVHWTHTDSAGRHPAGWIEHCGQLYQ